MGWESPQVITTEPVEGNYMLANSPLMKGNSLSAVLNPLRAVKWSSGGEQPIVGCVNSFSGMYREEVNENMRFIGMTGGEGGQTIEKLSKECTNDGYYESTFIKILDNTVAALEPSGSRVTCPAIVYMQGEYNCNTPANYTGKGLTPGSNGTVDKDEYKSLLLTLKNNMQADIMAKYGQSEKPLFFIYQTSGKYIAMYEMNIATAQYEFAKENEDVIMLNPHYALPDYSGGHLSTNGYRWYGEIIGKILYDVLVEEKDYQSLHPQNFTVEGSTLTIEYYVPVPPLVLDTWTTPPVSNYGFCVYKKGQRTTNLVNSVEIVEGTKVRLSCSQQLDEGIEVVYAGKPTSGTGNLCDSHNFTSMYTYFDDRGASLQETYTPTDEAGGSLYGKHYPMQNWSVSFYQSIAKVTTAMDGALPGNQPQIYFDRENRLLYVSGEVGLDTNITVFDGSGRQILSSRKRTVDLSVLPAGILIAKMNGIALKLMLTE
jgi:hypothetical protein